MSTPFTFNWRVSVRRQSLVDQEWYIVDLATGIDKKIAQDLAVELKRKGYEDVSVTLITSLP